MGCLKEWHGRFGPAASLLVACCLSLAAAAEGQSQPVKQAASRPAGAVPVLDTYGFWRTHNQLKPPVIQRDGKAEPVVFGCEWLDCETAAAPAGWAEPGFDDASWLRGPAHMACHTPYLSRLCMRGCFTVSDPAQVDDLSLTLVYQGGVIVYLNGKEVARRHLAAAGPGQAPVGEAYPAEACVDAQGKQLRGWDKKLEEQDAENQRRLALRSRELKAFRLPRASCRMPSGRRACTSGTAT